MAINTPFTTSVDFFVKEEGLTNNKFSKGSASLVSKIHNSSSPIGDYLYFLAINIRLVVDKYPPHIPPVC
jgi:hypothetical protein